jgi:NAD(P)-dependent dehydrogenase (short-subunit alcohol dehydrogenase family)
LASAIILSQQLFQVFIKQGYGNFIHMSSIQGVATPKFEHYDGTQMTSPIEYSAIKSGIISMTSWLAKYYKNNNIRVNCISPGGILDKQPDSFLEKYRESCTSKGMLDAEDVVGSVLFLLSDQSKYINGQNLIVDDGWSL